MKILNNEYLNMVGEGWAFLVGVLAAIAIFLIAIAVCYMVEVYEGWKKAGPYIAFAVAGLAVWGAVALAGHGHDIAQEAHHDFYTQIKELGWSEIDVDRSNESMTARLDGELQRCHFVTNDNKNWTIFCE